ncbi:hypothetical protein [Streptomyces sp. SYSU K217416]
MVLALLDTRGTRTYGRWWYRPAQRALRVGTVTPAELVRHTAPAHRTLLLPTVEVGKGFRWNVAERAAVRSEIRRLLHPVLRDPTEDLAALARRAHDFDGTLPELVAGAPATARGGCVAGLEAAILAAVPARPDAQPEFRPAPDRRARAAALKMLSVLHAHRNRYWQQIRWLGDSLASGLITGEDLVLHGAPARHALDPTYLFDHLDRFELPAAEAVAAAHARATALTRAALGDDPDAWWAVARTLPHFPGTLPDLLAAPSHRRTEGGALSTP